MVIEKTTMRKCCLMIQLFMLVLLVVFRGVVSKGEGIELNESRVSVLGWTDAHFVAYGWPIVGVTIARDTAAEFLEKADPAFLCLQNDFGQTALHLAVRQDHLPLVRFYAEKGLCLNVPNNDGDTPLHYAASWGRLEAAQILVDAEADISAKNQLQNTPRDDAISQNHDNIVSILDHALAKQSPESPMEL